jgi:tetratricopeptide (TPR) repeat protein
MKRCAEKHHPTVLLSFARRHPDVFPKGAMFKVSSHSPHHDESYRFSEDHDDFVFNLLTIHDFLGKGPSKTRDFILAARKGKVDKLQAALTTRREEIAALGAAFQKWGKVSAAWGQFIEKKDFESKRLPLDLNLAVESPAAVSPTADAPLPNLRAAQALADVSKKFATKDPTPEHMAAQAYYWVTLKRIDLARELLDEAATSHPKNGTLRFVRALCLIEEAEQAGASAYLHFEEGSGGMGAISAEEEYHDERVTSERERQIQAYEHAFELLIEAFENWPSRMPAALPVDLPFWRDKVAEKALGLFNRGFGRDIKGRNGVLRVLEQLSAERRGRIEIHFLNWWVQVLLAARLTQAPELPFWIESLKRSISRPLDVWHRRTLLPAAHPSDFVELPKEDWSWANPWPEALLSQKPEGFLASLLGGPEPREQAMLEAAWIHARAEVQADLLLHRHHLRAWAALNRLGEYQVLGGDYPIEGVVKLTAEVFENLPWRDSELSRRLRPRWAYAHFTALFVSTLFAFLKDNVTEAKARRDRARAFLDANPEIRRKRATHFYYLGADDDHGFCDLLNCHGHLLRPARHRWLRGVWLFPLENSNGLRDLLVRLESANPEASMWENLNSVLDG